MENPSFVRNVEMKLPIGFRFRPTDEELVVHYLKRKILSFPLPASVIPEHDVFQTHPWNLPGDLKEKRYFFSKRNGNGNGCIRVPISSGSGYWKVIKKKKHIVASQNNQAVGIKKTLVFYQGKSPHVSRTNWVMHEYSLLGFLTNPILNQKSVMEFEDWVVYRVFEKKRKLLRNKAISQQSDSKIRIKTTNQVSGQCCIDATVEENSDLDAPQPSSSSCSGEISEVFPNGTADQEETSGYQISLFSFSNSCMRKH